MLSNLSGNQILLLCPVCLVPPPLMLPTSGSEVHNGRADHRQLAAIIDRMVSETLRDKDVTPAPRADDSEYLRRVHLDIGDRTPAAAAVRGFLADVSVQKRDQVVDRLL